MTAGTGKFDYIYQLRVFQVAIMKNLLYAIIQVNYEPCHYSEQTRPQ